MKSNGKENLIKEYKKDGYFVQGHYMFLPKKDAATRAVKRFLGENGKRGRFVPCNIILGNTKNEANFDDFKPYFKKWSVYSSQTNPAKLIQRSK